MLEYDGIDLSERIDINKTDASKECKICHYWCFKDKFYFLCSGCHGLMQKAINLMMLLLFKVKEVVTEFTFGI